MGENHPATGVRFRNMFSIRRLKLSRSCASLCRGFATVLLFSLVGCSTTPAPSGGRWVVSAPQAEFYRHGPAQSANLPTDVRLNSTLADNTGPDFQLARGAVVTMVRREFGFSRVMTEDGNVGYVANEQLKPAPALASVVPMDVRPSRTLRSRTKPIPSAPLREEQLDLSDIPLPLPI